MRKKSLSIAGIIISLILQPWTAAVAENSSAAASIIISEIGAFEPSDSEWIEIHNKSEQNLDLAGYKFFEDSTNHGVQVFRGSAVLGVHEYAVIANKAEIFAQKYPDYLGTIFDSSWGSLKEEGEEIGIKDAAGNIIELLIYNGPSEAESSDGLSANFVSLERDTENPLAWKAVTVHSLGKAREIDALEPTIPELTNSAPPMPVISGEATEIQPAPIPAPEIPSAATAPSPAPEVSPVMPAPPPTESVPAPPSYTSPQTELAPVLPSSTSPQIPSPPPANSPPQAIIEIQSGNLIAHETTTINFDGRASFDPDGDRLTFIWDMGDGTSVNSQNPGLHKYDKPGTYVARLTVIDPKGATSEAHRYVQVLQKAEAAVKNSPAKNPALQPAVPGFSPLLPFAAQQLPQVVELRGYFYFSPGEPPGKSAKKNSTKPKKKKTAPKKPPAKKVQIQNGDLSTSIKITEIFPNPSAEDDTGEWVEISNQGTKPVNLGNWMLADSATKTSPYHIGSGITLLPNESAVFPKSETKISLNNDMDSIVLRDFEGTGIDEISYTDSKKGHSYALIPLSGEPELVASTDLNIGLGSQPNEVWEWTSEPTPGDPNPIFEKISGKINRLLVGGDALANPSFEMLTSAGDSKIIQFDTETLNPFIRDSVIHEGNDISLKAQKRRDGAYELKKIDEVKLAPPSEKPKEKTSLWFWIGVSMLALSVTLNMLPFIGFLRKYFRDKKPPI